MTNITKINSKLSSNERILLNTDGSVTKILDVLFGGIHIKLLKQQCVQPPQKIQNIFGTNVLLTKRQVMIYSNHLPLMYAKSFCDLSISPNQAQDMIKKGQVPIGRILNHLKIETRREILSVNCKKMNKKYKMLFNCNGEIIMRKYVIYHTQRPLFHIKEVFVRGTLT